MRQAVEYTELYNHIFVGSFNTEQKEHWCLGGSLQSQRCVVSADNSSLLQFKGLASHKCRARVLNQHDEICGKRFPSIRDAC